MKQMCLDCSSYLPMAVKVNAVNYIYNEPGYFSCPQNGILFNKKSHKLAINATVCKASAKWHNEDNVQCWYSKLHTNKVCICLQ